MKTNISNPKQRKYTCADFFCCAGGVGSGIKAAGFDIKYALDYDGKALANYKHNFPEAVTKQQDINTFDYTEVEIWTRLKPGEIDLIHFSPDCDCFSMCGKRQIFDPRNEMYFTCIDLAKRLQPKVFTMETVDGITMGDAKLFLMMLLYYLDMIDMYNFEWRVLNACDYSVPQSRERFILIAVRKDLGIMPVFPKVHSKIITLKDICPNVDFVSSTQFGKVLRKSDRPCCTLTSGKSMLFYENGFFRYPTLEEIWLLSTFPENHEFIGTDTEKWAYMGNCIPPKFYQAIAETIRIEILDKYYRSL